MKDGHREIHASVCEKMVCAIQTYRNFTAGKKCILRERMTDNFRISSPHLRSAACPRNPERYHLFLDPADKPQDVGG